MKHASLKIFLSALLLLFKGEAYGMDDRGEETLFDVIYSNKSNDFFSLKVNLSEEETGSSIHDKMMDKLGNDLFGNLTVGKGEGYGEPLEQFGDDETILRSGSLMFRGVLKFKPESKIDNYFFEIKYLLPGEIDRTRPIIDRSRSKIEELGKKEKTPENDGKILDELNKIQIHTKKINEYITKMAENIRLFEQEKDVLLEKKSKKTDKLRKEIETKRGIILASSDERHKRTLNGMISGLGTKLASAEASLLETRQKAMRLSQEALGIQERYLSIARELGVEVDSGSGAGGGAGAGASY
jgi:hypothetical protein